MKTTPPVRLLLLFLLFSPLSKADGNTEVSDAKPLNVLFIICDDLNDYVAGIGGQVGHPQTNTPHIAKFAESATSFPLAYTVNPVCAPSRSSLFYGMYPQTSGAYFWEEWYLASDRARNSFTMNRFFKENGYRTVGSGKVNHHMWEGYRKRNSEAFAANRDLEWSEFKHQTDYGPFWGTSGSDFRAMPEVPSPFRNLSDMPGSTPGIDNSFGSMKAAWESPKRREGERFFYGGAPYWGAPFKYNGEDDRDLTPDEKNAAWAVQKLKEFESQSEPFFLAVGFVRPHTPLHAPQKYFDLFPLEPGGIVDQVLIARLKEGDIEDTHMHDLVPMEDHNRNKGPRYYQLLLESYDDDKLHALRVYTQAYLACVAAVDDAIGEVLSALDNSPLADNTVVVVTSDHGYNIGEKEWLFKASPWEESCRVPLVIRVPGMTTPGATVDHVPVSLVDLYPTLVDLCGLPTDTRINDRGAFLDGHSLRPLLEDPVGTSWHGPEAAITLIHNSRAGGDPSKHHYSIRSEHYRYIRYSNGKEELYNHAVDADEWDNVIALDTTAAAHHRKLLDQMLEDIAQNQNRF